MLAVSQIALTQAACDDVYATAGYEDSVTNMKRTTLQSDNVFGDDGGIYQLATMTGSAATGLHGGAQRHHLDSEPCLHLPPPQTTSRTLARIVSASPSSFHAAHEAARRLDGGGIHRAG